MSTCHLRCSTVFVMSSEPRCLVISELGHRFPETQMLFRGLDATLAPGEVVALVGPSGSGKSTLLSIIAGWLKPTHGVIERHGLASVSWVFQNPHGVPRRTAIDHVVLPLLAKGLYRSEAEVLARDVLDRFNLGGLGDRSFHALSGGEAQRLMLARAVALGPDLLLVDEPTAQLDAVTAATVNAVLAETASSATLVVVATHDPDTRNVCTRVMNLGDYARDIK